MTDDEKSRAIAGEDGVEFRSISRLCPACCSKNTSSQRTAGQVTYCKCGRCGWTYKRPSVAALAKNAGG